MTPIIAITGPTAVGKSAVADELAHRLGTEVLSADAMQVYRGMDIGTAKTPAAERLVPLRLIDLVDVDEPYSAALYQRDARSEINRLQKQGKVPVFCGGTGLYLRAALDDMVFPKGEVSDERRSQYNQMAADLGAEELHRLLAERDAKSAELIHPHNVKRVIRALEMCDEGSSYAEQAAGFSTPRAVYPYVSYALSMERSRLYERIDKRVDLMMDQGLLYEVKNLVSSGVADSLTARQAIGYKEIIDALDGKTSLDEAVSLIKQRSRRYAKRQLSWCRRDERIRWISMDEHDVSSAVDAICAEMGL
ncbi:MAG: tRNA (adenosine(37)-N6)-dimethylallyltransferase MiaA [Coriobacteriaceae bacterium]|nr:tRNA (adenosine(37)-N6)-dimethylallyltransferase MiaA [Coriobacteriaceae bacterium]